MESVEELLVRVSHGSTEGEEDRNVEQPPTRLQRDYESDSGRSLVRRASKEIASKGKELVRRASKTLESIKEFSKVAETITVSTHAPAALQHAPSLARQLTHTHPTTCDWTQPRTHHRLTPRRLRAKILCLGDATLTRPHCSASSR